MNIAVTGATGFVGRALCGVLRDGGHRVTEFSRSTPAQPPALHDSAAWRRALEGIDAVVHLAGRAHVAPSTAKHSADEFFRVNVDGTLAVARGAAAGSVRRFVFVSSIGVLGNESRGAAFSERTPPAPVEQYAISKLQAEAALREAESDLGLEIVIVRPPLVYGPCAKGNWLRLLRLVESGIPLPFGGVRNLKSFVGVKNLSELLMLCAVRPLGEHRLFVASDGRDLSTPELLRLLSDYMGRRSRLVSVPLPLVKALALASGRRAEFRALTCDLQVDSGLARAALGWNPSESIEHGLSGMVDWYMRAK